MAEADPSIDTVKPSDKAAIERLKDLGVELRPEWSALLMSLSPIIVVVNAVLLKRVERDLDGPSPSISLSGA